MSVLCLVEQARVQMNTSQAASVPGRHGPSPSAHPDDQTCRLRNANIKMAGAHEDGLDSQLTRLLSDPTAAVCSAAAPSQRRQPPLASLAPTCAGPKSKDPRARRGRERAGGRAAWPRHGGSSPASGGRRPRQRGRRCRGAGAPTSSASRRSTTALRGSSSRRGGGGGSCGSCRGRDGATVWGVGTPVRRHREPRVG